jgi:hypothetical protein
VVRKRAREHHLVGGRLADIGDVEVLQEVNYVDMSQPLEWPLLAALALTALNPSDVLAQ